jgi:hypothetical protein
MHHRKSVDPVNHQSDEYLDEDEQQSIINQLESSAISRHVTSKRILSSLLFLCGIGAQYAAFVYHYSSNWMISAFYGIVGVSLWITGVYAIMQASQLNSSHSTTQHWKYYALGLAGFVLIMPVVISIMLNHLMMMECVIAIINMVFLALASYIENDLKSMRISLDALSRHKYKYKKI